MRRVAAPPPPATGARAAGPPVRARRRPARKAAVASAVVLALGVVAGCGSDEPSPAAPAVLVDLATAFPDLAVGDVIALRASADEPTAVEWIERRTGRIMRLSVDQPTDAASTATSIETLATIEVGTDGEQRGLLGHTVIDGVRYVAFTEPADDHLVVAALDADGAIDRIVWDAGGTAGGAVGGHVEAVGGRLVLGIGQLTDWAKARGSGAMVSLDPNGPPDQQPAILSDGYTNPFAFVTVDGAVWVADNAVGDDVEHIGRADLADRSRHTPTGAAPRAPSAMVSLDDGRLAVCGFLDGQLLPWSPDNRSVDATPVATNPVDTTPATPAPDPVTAADDTTVPPGSTGYGPSLGPCRTGAATLADGSIVTVTDTAIVLLPDRPTP